MGKLGLIFYLDLRDSGGIFPVEAVFGVRVKCPIIVVDMCVGNV